MRNDIIVLVTESSHNDDSKGILYAFNSHGLIEQEVLSKVLGQVSIAPEGLAELHARKVGLEPQIGSTFKSEESFHQFVYELCGELGASSIRILSRHDFNSLCEECLSVSEFHQKLEGFGEVVANLEHNTKSNFFKKLFH